MWEKIYFLSHMKMFGGGALLQNGIFLYIFGTLLPTTLDFVKTLITDTRLYNASAATNRMSGKTLWAEIFEAKVGNLGHFYGFFDFSSVFRKLLAKYASYQKIFVQQKLDLIKTHLFHSSYCFYDLF